MKCQDDIYNTDVIRKIKKKNNNNNKAQYPYLLKFVDVKVDVNSYLSSFQEVMQFTYL